MQIYTTAADPDWGGWSVIWQYLVKIIFAPYRGPYFSPVTVYIRSLVLTEMWPCRASRPL